MWVDFKDAEKIILSMPMISSVWGMTIAMGVETILFCYLAMLKLVFVLANINKYV